jgi:hypothetical protein
VLGFLGLDRIYLVEELDFISKTVKVTTKPCSSTTDLKKQYAMKATLYVKQELKSKCILDAAKVGKQFS